MLRFSPLASASYKAMPAHHLFSLALSAPYVPVSFLVGNPFWHLLQLLAQQAISASLTWLHYDDVSNLTAPVTEAAPVKPKLTMKVSHLASRSAAKEEEPKEPKVAEAAPKVGERNVKYLYEEKYPELIATMIQKKMVDMSMKEGFTFMEYYCSRGNKKNNWRVWFQTGKAILLHIKDHVVLAMRLLLLLAEQSEQRGLGHAHDLETDSRNITHGVTGTTETGNQHLVVLIHVVQATITRHEGSDLLAVLDELHTNALTNGGVGLLGLHTPIPQSKNGRTYTFSRTMPLAMVAPPSTLALIEEMLWPFLYFYSVNTFIDKANLIGPSLLATDNAKLASSTNTTRLTKISVRNRSPDERDQRTTKSSPFCSSLPLPFTHSF